MMADSNTWELGILATIFSGEMSEDSNLDHCLCSLTLRQCSGMGTQLA